MFAGVGGLSAAAEAALAEPAAPAGDSGGQFNLVLPPVPGTPPAATILGAALVDPGHGPTPVDKRPVHPSLFTLKAGSHPDRPSGTAGHGR